MLFLTRMHACIGTYLPTLPMEVSLGPLEKVLP